MQYKIISICKGDIDAVTETIFQAFDEDPLMLWLFGEVDEYRKRARQFMSTWVRYTVLYGIGFRTEDSSSVVLFKKPGDKKPSFWRMIRSGMIKSYSILGKEAFGRLMQLDKALFAHSEQLMGDQQYLYCWALATKKNARGKGYGTALMQHGFQSMQSQFPCYFETQSESNRLYYEKIGYKELARFSLEGADFPIICLCQYP